MNLRETAIDVVVRPHPREQGKKQERSPYDTAFPLGPLAVAAGPPEPDRDALARELVNALDVLVRSERYAPVVASYSRREYSGEHELF